MRYGCQEPVFARGALLRGACEIHRYRALTALYGGRLRLLSFPPQDLDSFHSNSRGYRPIVTGLPQDPNRGEPRRRQGSRS